MSASANGSLVLPTGFTFYRAGFVDFDKIFKLLDWNPAASSLTIDLSSCESSNYQVLALLILYAWHLTSRGYSVSLKYGISTYGSTKMLTKMGAIQWRDILMNDGMDFGFRPGKQTYALRRRSDVQNTINTARNVINNYVIKFPEYLSYIISELLYNATEHGRSQATIEGCKVIVPSVFQFGYYPQLKRLSFLFADLGMGIRAHLEQAYPPFPSNQDAIIYALRPNVSGTFSSQAEPYTVKNNAGLGLTYSSLMLKRLKGNMYIVSHDGVVHVSPEDFTSRRLQNPWPGTFVLINLDLSAALDISLEQLLSEIQSKAETEVAGASANEDSKRLHVSIYNYFGKYAEDKDAAIKFRDQYIFPAIADGKMIELDFSEVETAPHSFLNALLATPVHQLGIKAYQWLTIKNALGSIHEIVRGVLDSNLPKLS